MGWVHRRRDLGGVHLHSPARPRRRHAARLPRQRRRRLHAQARRTVRSEYVIAVEGVVALRTAETINPAIATGEVELVVEKLWILNESRTPPFPMEDNVDVNEDARLKYRYVDLRRPRMQRNIILRSKIAFAVRQTLMTRRAFSKSKRPS